MPPDDYTAEDADQSPTGATADWFNTFLLTTLPLVGFVLLCAWTFGRTTPPSKANWARAMLLLYVLALVLGLAFIGLTWLARPTSQQLMTGPGYQAVP